jgi:hypothetical protein
MPLLRRLLTGILAFALTQFGVIAVAPAHAHESGAAHGLRAIVLTHDHSDIADRGDHHHDHDDDADVSEALPVVADGAGEQPAEPDPDSNHGEHVHVHACPQFAPLGNDTAAYVPVSYAELLWPLTSAPAMRHSSSPPLRPPRASL